MSSRTKGGKLAASEAKGGANVAAGEAIPQLENTMKKIAEKGLAGDVDRIEIIMSRWAMIKEKDYKILNGYLVMISEGNKPVQISAGGFKWFVQVVQL